MGVSGSSVASHTFARLRFGFHSFRSQNLDRAEESLAPDYQGRCGEVIAFRSVGADPAAPSGRTEIKVGPIFR